MVLDVGQRLMICGVIIDHKTGNYRHLKFSTGTYHHMCKKYMFDKLREALTATVDKAMRDDREAIAKASENGLQPSSRSYDFETYAQHTLKYFNRAMAVYGSEEYAKINYDAWLQTKRTLIYIVRMLVGLGQQDVVVIVGDKLPAANSLCFGYRKTQVHGLFKLLAEHPRCTVYYGSEYRSTKCCCRCGQVLQDARMGESRWKAWSEDRTPRNRGNRTQKSRTKVCLMCKPMDIAAMLPEMRAPLPTNTVFVLKNNREMRLEREAARRINDDNAQAIGNNHNGSSSARSAPLPQYSRAEKVTWKIKYKISKTTGKRVRSRKVKLRTHQNDDYNNMDLSLSMWKRHKFAGAYALDATASRTFDRDINAAINIRTLCKWQ